VLASFRAVRPRVEPDPLNAKALRQRALVCCKGTLAALGAAGGKLRQRPTRTALKWSRTRRPPIVSRRFQERGGFPDDVWWNNGVGGAQTLLARSLPRPMPV
jgi:hypothetical protein